MSLCFAAPSLVGVESSSFGIEGTLDLCPLEMNVTSRYHVFRASVLVSERIRILARS